MRRMRMAAASAALLTTMWVLPATAQPAVPTDVGQTGILASRVCQDPIRGQVACGVGGSDGSGGGTGGAGGSGGGYDGQITNTWDICGGFWDVDGNGTIDPTRAIDYAPAGWGVEPDGCAISGPNGEYLRWVVKFNAWMEYSGGALRRLADAPPPTGCDANPSGSWYYGFVATTNAPQPIWGNPATSAGVCPAPGDDPVQIARDIVASYIETMLSTGELGITPPEGSAYPASVGVPVRVWFENPIEGETIGTSSPITETEGPVTVTMDVELASVTVDWGDGNTSECAYNPESGTVGTPFEEGQDPLTFDSGCQHAYETLSVGQPDSAFTVSALSHWDVHWSVSTSDGLLEGVESVDTPASQTAVQVGEVQTRR